MNAILFFNVLDLAVGGGDPFPFEKKYQLVSKVLKKCINQHFSLIYLSNLMNWQYMINYYCSLRSASTLKKQFFFPNFYFI